MGKPFKRELEKVYDTFTWAVSQPIDALRESIFDNIDRPLIAVGSGGSLSACYYAMLLFQQYGSIAKAITPLEVQYSTRILKKANLLFLSASGKNSDVLYAFKLAIENEPKSILAISMKEKTPLNRLASQYTDCKSFEYNIPAGKDGFLATNSLVAFFTILHKVFKQYEGTELLTKPANNFFNDLEFYCKSISSNNTYTILYGGWGLPIAIDLESKFAEASLGNIFLSDYRNFGHGRHHWFAKRNNQSSIIAIVTPEEEKIAKKTLSLIPSNIPKLVLRSEYTTSFASVELLIKSFYLVEQVGSIQNIDPGRPHVPDFGRKLYNLKYSSYYKPPKQIHYELAIKRKNQISTFSQLNLDEQEYWIKKYNNFIFKLTDAKFGSIVLDYDGTICSLKNRLIGPSLEILNEVVRILESGFIVGFATGRGGSVREILKKVLPEKHWENVIIGYYNGSDLGTLSEELHPNKKIPVDMSLIRIKNIIDATSFPFKTVKIDERPFQFTFSASNKIELRNMKNLIQNILMREIDGNVIFVESSHTFDIIVKPQTSKLNILPYCKKKANTLGISEEVLCIGDKGQWPGNDYELLSTPYSLSVDEVSIEPNSCWNIASVGLKNTDACIEYFKMIKTFSNYFELRTK